MYEPRVETEQACPSGAAQGRQGRWKWIARCGQGPQHEDQLGGKAGALARLASSQLPIPEWFVVTPGAFHASLDAHTHRALERAHSSEEILRLLGTLELSPQLQHELREALAALCPDGARVAVRSSAMEEDGENRSFAGQLESFLYVAPADVPAKIADVWRSAFSERALAYARRNSDSRLPRPPAVLIQRMVNAEAAGVAFSADPVTGRRGVAVVSAVLGLGTSLVSGQCDADTFHVDRHGRIIRRAIARKVLAHRLATDGGVRVVALDEEPAARPVLTDAQVLAVAELARRAEAFFGRPQDVEWAVEDGRVYLLQFRPITALCALPDPDGAFALWDNSNIVESYGGITTPLTFAFARQAYEEVYRQFCRILHVAPRRIEESASVFRCMLGFIRGRVYYNLLNWYRLLALLPGFTINRGFMEQMMGVKEVLPADALPASPPARWHERLRDAFRFLVMVCALVWHHFTLPRQIRKFHRRVAEALGPGQPDLSRLRPDELLGLYRELEGKLLRHWDAPLINDFLAMIFYGALRKLTAASCRDTSGTLQNDLLCGEGGMISAEPAARVRHMALLAARQPGLAETLRTGSQSAILGAMKAAPELFAAYLAYLDDFGDRCLDELKLESLTLHDDPLPLLRSIGQLASGIKAGDAHTTHGGTERALRNQAEQRVRQGLAGSPLSRWIYSWVLKNARHRVRDRENLRFERTRVFGRVRRIFLELGRRLAAVDRLADPSDVFYLELEEILSFIEGTASCTNLKGLVALRRAERKEFTRSEPPANRFETRGAVYQGNSFRGLRAAPVLDGDRRQGIGCCSSKVHGRVCVVRDPSHADPPAGSILVAERTDPGWVLLFPFAAGVLVERGSLLSHSAILAREMGVPTVVSIEGLTSWLNDGDWVEFDGATGLVVRVPAPVAV